MCCQGKDLKMDDQLSEKTPMMSTRVTTAGAISIPSSANSEPSRSWLERKFWALYAFGFILTALMVALIVLCVVLIVRLRSVEGNSQAAIARGQNEIRQLAQSLKLPIDPETLKRLDQMLRMQMPQAPPTPPPPPLPGATPINASVFGPRRFPEPKHQWRGCSKLGQCSRLDFAFRTPPLVIVSLDGFAREYLDRGIVKSLDYLAECGVTAERVLPSFPSKTFPNHYTIATGLYPAAHGIVDNNVFDPSVGPTMESMKNVRNIGILKGNPIWSVYKRDTGGKSACMMYPMCVYNNTGYAADFAPPYNHELPFRNRIDTVISWLKKPPADRPGFIAAYLHQPDQTGHYQKDESDVNEELLELDKKLDYLIKSLYDENLLECINLVVLSDHGMSRLNHTIYFDEHVDDLQRMATASGVVGRIHLNASTRTPDDVAETFACKTMAGTHVWTQNDIPPRKHYSGTTRVGDVIVEGQPGTAFYGKAQDDYHLTGDHGYDNQHEEMHTIFFARGPSLKPNRTVAEFQNIEYMNLWMDLLQIKNRVPNNGTDGLFDEILARPPPARQLKPAIRESSTVDDGYSECASFHSVIAEVCANCTGTSLSPEELLGPTCRPPAPPIASVPANEVCYMDYCHNSVVHFGIGSDSALVEFLSSRDFVAQKSLVGGCPWINAKYVDRVDCPDSGVVGTSIALNNASVFSKMPQAFVELPPAFVKDILDVLNVASMDFLKGHETLLVISGTAYDSNHDGVADVDPSGPVTHFYRVLVACDGGWTSSSAGRCEKVDQMKALAFLFPITARPNRNCMTADELLLEYSARLRDVELIVGFEFRFDGLDFRQNLMLRTKNYRNLSLF